MVLPIRRQTRQASYAGGIRVVNLDTGAADVWKAVGNAADTFEEIAYKESVRKAQQTVEDRVASMTRDDIFSIDPVTGRYSSISIPKSYGRVAADAHRELIRNRFASDFEAELKEVASEMASKYGSTQYKEMLSKHVESMRVAASNEDGSQSPFSAMISDFGDDYVARTYAALRDKEIAAAKKANENAATIRLAELGATLQSLSVTGSFGETYQKTYDEYERLMYSLYASNNDAAQFNRHRKDMRGFTAGSYSGMLISNLASMDEGPQKALALQFLQGDATALDQIENMTLRSQLVTWAIASGGEGGDTVIRRINGVDESQEAAKTSQLAEARAQYSFDGSADLASITNAVNSIALKIPMDQDDKVAMMSGFIMDALEDLAADFNGEALTAFSDDLRTGELTKSKNKFKDPEKIQLFFDSLTEEDRKTLDDFVSSKYTTTSRIEADEEANTLGKIKVKIFKFKDDRTRGSRISDILESKYLDLKKEIEQSGLSDSNIAVQLDSLNLAFSEQLIKSAQELVIQAVDDFGNVTTRRMTKDEVNSISEYARSRNIIGTSNLQEAVWNKAKEFRRAYELNPSATSAALGALSKSAESSAARDELEIRKNIATHNIKDGIATAEQVKLFEEASGIDNMVIRDMLQITEEGKLALQPDVKMMIEGGYLPTAVKQAAELIGRGGSYDEQGMNFAFQVFEAAMNTGDMYGNTVNVLRNNISAEAFGSISEAVRLSRMGYGTPVDIMNKMRMYDGNLTNDINGVLDNKTLDQFVGQMVVDGMIGSFHQGRVKSIIRMNYANNVAATEEAMTEMIKNHFEQIGATDDAVFAPGFSFGERNEYSRFGIKDFTATNAAAAEKEFLQRLLEQKPEMFERDAIVDVIADQFLDSIFGMVSSSRMTWNAMFGDENAVFEDWKYETTEARISAFAERFQGKIKYQPITNTFERDPMTGQFTKGVYVVGFESTTGGFIPITLNGETLKLDTEEYQNRTAWFTVGESIPPSAMSYNKVERDKAANRWREAGKKYGASHENTQREYIRYLGTLKSYQKEDGTPDNEKIKRQLYKKFKSLMMEP